MSYRMREQLFLLHFAGGSVYSFDFLKRYMKSNIEFIPIELPGRGKRFSEDLLKTKEEAVEDYVNQIKVLRNGNPYLIYGHSMGATLGLSVTAKLEAISDPPKQLIVSGNPGPGIKKYENISRYLLDDFHFKEELKKLGGVPKELLENEEFDSYFIPIMRADFEVLENDTFSEKDIKLKTPINALMGSEEDTCKKIENWKGFTSGDFRFKILSGNHFFIHEHPSKLADIINSYSNYYDIFLDKNRINKLKN